MASQVFSPTTCRQASSVALAFRAKQSRLDLREEEQGQDKKPPECSKYRLFRKNDLGQVFEVVGICPRGNQSCTASTDFFVSLGTALNNYPQSCFDRSGGVDLMTKV